MRYRLIVLSLLLCLATPAAAQVSVSIGINVPVYPVLVPVPGYPVYYAPSLNTNYFFYDGMYWVYDGENWHASFWYNGPWRLVAPVAVPVYVLRIPVRYYRLPPPHFHRWQPDAPPRWHERWGPEWERHRRGWDRWDSRSAPPPAPLPTYQRDYSSDRYPRTEQQQQGLVRKNYRHQPRDPAVREHYQQLRTRAEASAPAGESRQPAEPRQKTPRQPEQSTPRRMEQSAPPPQRERSAAPPLPPQRTQEEQMPKSEGRTHEPRGKGAPPEAKAPPQKGKAKGEGKGHDDNK